MIHIGEVYIGKGDLHIKHPPLQEKEAALWIYPLHLKGGPCSDASEAKDHDPSDSEEESSASISTHEKALVGGTYHSSVRYPKDRGGGCDICTGVGPF